MFFDRCIGFGSVWFLAVLMGWLGAGLREAEVSAVEVLGPDGVWC